MLILSLSCLASLSLSSSFLSPIHASAAEEDPVVKAGAANAARIPWDQIPQEQKEIVFHIMSTKNRAHHLLSCDFMMLCDRESFVTPQDISKSMNEFRGGMQDKLNAARTSLREADIDSIDRNYNTQLNLLLGELDRQTAPYQKLIQTITEHFGKIGINMMFDEEGHTGYLDELKPLAAVYAALKGQLNQYFPKDALESREIVTSLLPHPQAKELLEQQQVRLEQERLQEERRQRQEQQRLQEERRQRQEQQRLQGALEQVNTAITTAQRLNPYKSANETIMGVGRCAGALRGSIYEGYFLWPRMDRLLKEALTFHRIQGKIPEMTNQSVFQWYQELIQSKTVEISTAAEIRTGLTTIATHNISDQNMMDVRSPYEAYMQSLGLVRLLFDKYPKHPDMLNLLTTTFAYIEDQARNCATGARGRAALTFQQALIFLVNLPIKKDEEEKEQPLL